LTSEGFLPDFSDLSLLASRARRSSGFHAIDGSGISIRHFPLFLDTPIPPISNRDERAHVTSQRNNGWRSDTSSANA
jgi:hypothetical protein